MADLEEPLRKLSRTAGLSPYPRVFAWRSILDRVWRDGFDAGYCARDRDARLSDEIAEREAARAADPERTES